MLLQGQERCPVRAFKEMSGEPKSRYHVWQGRTWDHRQRRESPGDTGPVIAAGVTPRRGRRETLRQGEGGQAMKMTQAERHAQCRAPKRSRASCVNAAGGTCRE